MYPWRRILVPTDFSTASAWVFDDAVRIAGTTGAEIVILHVRMTWTAHPDELRLPADESLYEYAEKIELDKLHERVRRANASIPARLLVRRSPDAGPEICRTALAEEVDLIVMATHARHHVAHLLLGSTTREVLTNAHVPLLAIRYGIKRRSGMRNVVVPVHRGQTSDAALRLAASVAQWEGGEVHLVTVSSDAEAAAAETLLASLAAERLASIRSSKAVLRGTDVDREVIRHIEKSNADSLFMNAADEPSPLKIELIRRAPVPVMMVPAE